MPSEKFIHSSISFKERRHMLCLKPPSYYCNSEDNLPLSAYTKPFSLGTEGRGWCREGKIRLLRGVRRSALQRLTSPLSLSLDIHPFLKFRRSGCERKSIQCHVRWRCLTEMFQIQNLKELSKSFICIVLHHEQVSKHFTEEKKRTRGSEWEQMRKKYD